MKKLFITLLTLFYCATVANAVEEISLPQQSINLSQLADIYYGKAENQQEISPIFRLFSEKGLEFENSKINSVKATILYGSQATYDIPDSSNSSFKHNFPVIEPMVTVKFNNNKSQAKFDYNIARSIKGHPNSFTEKINELYVSHDITKNQTILFGQGSRLPITHDGSLGVFANEMVLKTQIGRTFGDVRSVGIRNIGNYKYADYDIGIYDSTRYMRDFGRGSDFTAYIMFKPFANTENDALNFKLGGGYNTGKYNISYNQYSFYTQYDYKKFHAKAEYANADGYNTNIQSQNKSDGFYTTISYDITPKISVIGRYDYFAPNKSESSMNNQEYTFGLTYMPWKKMKLMFNYVRRNFSYKNDSNMLLFAARFII